MSKIDFPPVDPVLDHDEPNLGETPEELGYQDLPEINEVVEKAVDKLTMESSETLAKWQTDIDHIKTNLASGLLSKSGARMEIDVLTSELNTIRAQWEGKVSAETRQKIDALSTQLRELRKNTVGLMEKAKKWLVGPLAGLGIMGATKAADEYQEFKTASAETLELAGQEGEFTPPPVPDSFLVMPEKVQLAPTKDLFKKFERYVKEHPGKGLDLSVEESEPGLLGVYLKFGRQIDRSVKFSDKFLPELSQRLDIPETDLQKMQAIFHESIYVQPPSMGGGTSSVFYSSNNILSPKGHEEFYAGQVNNSVELAKHIVPQIEGAPEKLQPELQKAFGEFLKAELAIRAYDERIKDAIANQRDFELEGTEGAYNDDVPSLFTRQNFHLEKRASAIAHWYEVLGTVHPGASVEKNLVGLAVNLQGWADKRSVALNLSKQESQEGILLGGDPTEWNEYIKNGDNEYRKNAKALETLLAEYQPIAPTVASK